LVCRFQSPNFSVDHFRFHLVNTTLLQKKQGGGRIIFQFSKRAFLPNYIFATHCRATGCKNGGLAIDSCFEKKSVLSRLIFLSLKRGLDKH